MLMALITRGDFIELFSKIQQRGWKYIFSKFHLNKTQRIRTTFNNIHINSANWWIIPEVRKRWNKKISGNQYLDYEDYLVDNYLKNKTGLRMLSIGCGIGSHEIKFAQHPCFALVKGIDLSPKLVNAANEKARKLQLSNLQYQVANVYKYDFKPAYCDLVLFHSSLHHFSELDVLIGKHIKNCLNPGGVLVINEYVGPDRLQWSKAQLNKINELLAEMPVKYRKRYLSSRIKQREYKPGILRMKISDPSEAICSSSILPVIHHYFKCLEEKSIGGNILMMLLKDIAHHFVNENPEKIAVLHELFKAEDRYLATHNSDFVFGVYQK